MCNDVLMCERNENECKQTKTNNSKKIFFAKKPEDCSSLLVASKNKLKNRSPHTSHHQPTNQPSHITNNSHPKNTRGGSFYYYYSVGKLPAHSWNTVHCQEWIDKNEHSKGRLKCEKMLYIFVFVWELERMVHGKVTNVEEEGNQGDLTAKKKEGEYLERENEISTSKILLSKYYYHAQNDVP